MSHPLTAVEFFSGIGAFAEACRFSAIEVVAAFDQNEHANKVYESNFGLKPDSRNLESLKSGDIPRASIWWMSPPCTPFSRRGKQKDEEDPRAQALLNLIEILPDHLPDYFFMENVEGFIDSNVGERLNKTLDEHGYKRKSFNICSSMFGVPMRRPRHFIAASRLKQPVSPLVEAFAETRRLAEFLTRNTDESLFLKGSEVQKYRAVLNIVDYQDENAYLICFTRGYYKCRTASGSLIQLPDGNVRFVAPEEILDLFGFSKTFSFPASMPMPTRWRLVGNSVDVRAIKAVMSSLQHC